MRKTFRMQDASETFFAKEDFAPGTAAVLDLTEGIRYNIN